MSDANEKAEQQEMGRAFTQTLVSVNLRFREAGLEAPFRCSGFAASALAVADMGAMKSMGRVLDEHEFVELARRVYRQVRASLQSGAPS